MTRSPLRSHPAPASGADPTPLSRVVVVGVVAGFFAGLFGVGGGILIVPGLVLATHMPQRLAHGTSLAAVVPIAFSSLITYVAHDNVDWPAATWLTAGAVAGAVLGTRLLHRLPQHTLGLLFSGILVLAAIRLFLSVDATGRDALSLATATGLVALGAATGVLAGLLGVGGGIVMVPAMIVLFAIPPVIAKGTSAAVIIPTALIGTWRNRSKGNADLRAAAVLGGSGILTAAIGATLSDRMGESLSNVLFAILLTLVAARLLWQLADRE